MIPREILKKVRQIELRTNRIVTETLANAMNIKNGMTNREIHQIRERGFGIICSCSRISRGSELNPF
jgi:hypothetical protein